MLTSGPLLALILPFVDLGDIPPMQTPPMPNGAARMEAHAGWFLAVDTGIEFETSLVGAGYLVSFPDGSRAKRGTLATRLAATWFTPGESDMPLDRFWVGPFIRAEGSTDLLGRHEGLEFGSVNKAVLDFGFRFSLREAHPSDGTSGGVILSQ